MHTSFFRVILVLTRFPVSLAVAFTAFTALVLSSAKLTFETIMPIAGIFLLASGASALNQYQEWPYDEKMERTRRRPVPSRRISTAEAQRVALLGIVGGLVILFMYAPPLCILLGIFNLVWYNLVYTYLKRVTAFAVVPGALTGVIPVFMGWTAGKGELTAPDVLFLGFFIFIWQMPHFWMMTLKYGNEYRAAGFPVLNDLFGETAIKGMVMAWMTASSAASLLLAWFGIFRHPMAFWILAGMNAALLLLMAWQLFLAARLRYRLIFISANIFMLLVMLALIGDRVIF